MQNKFENIISSDFGKIRQIYFNKFVEAFLVETDYGFQFILKEGKILINNVDHKFKIIGNTFPDEQVVFILQNSLYRKQISKLIVRTTTNIWWVAIQDYYCSSDLMTELDFPFFQYFNGHLYFVKNTNRILLADAYKGLVCYNIMTNRVEYEISTYATVSKTLQKEKEIILALDIYKFELSENEKYFYIMTAMEGKCLYVFRTSDYCLLYNELFSSYALSEGIFYNDYSYSKKKHFDEAIESLNKAIKLKPDFQEAYYNLGITYGDKGEYDKAIEYLNKSLYLKPNDFDTYYHIGIAYLEKDNYDKAIEYLNKATQLKPDNIKTLEILGIAYAHIGNIDKSVEHFNKAIPEFHIELNNLGNTKLESGEYDVAIELFNRAIQIKPYYSEAYYGLGLAYEKKGHSSKSKKSMKKAKELGCSKADKWLKSMINEVKDKMPNA